MILNPKLKFNKYSKNWVELDITQVLKIGSGRDYKHLSYGEFPLYGTGGLMTHVNDYLYDGESVCIGRKGTIDKPTYLIGKFWTVDTLFYTYEFENIIPKFTYYIFQNINWKLYSEASGVPSLSKSTIEKIKIIIPSTKEEQTKIADFLTVVDDKIELLASKKQKLMEYKKGVMQKLFSQQLRFKDLNGVDYGDWENVSLGNIAIITTGSSNRIDSNLNGKYTFFDRSQDIRSSDTFIFDAEAIIVPGEGQEFIPKYFKGKFDLHQRTYAIMDFQNQNGIFLFYSIGYNVKHLNSQAVGSTVKSLRLPMFEKMPIYLPNINEQTKIANFLTSLDDKINITDSELSKLKIWKKGLLQQMFV
jgi:type I restriction enzyme, S subunit